MDWLIWVGACVSFTGLGGLIYCISRVWKARRAGMDEEGLRIELQKVIPINTGALFLSIIGLMIVVIGIFLG